MSLLRTTRYVLWVMIAPGIPLGWLSTKLLVWAMKRLEPDVPVAGSHSEEFLGLSTIWAGVAWVCFVLYLTGYL